MRLILFQWIIFSSILWQNGFVYAETDLPAVPAPKDAGIVSGGAATVPLLSVSHSGTASVIQAKPWNGDFRYRYQSEIDGADEERLLNRFRVRLGTTFLLNDKASFNFRLMSYSKPDGSAASGNVNLGDSSGYGFQRRLIGIDQAFMELGPAERIKLNVGKFPMGFVFAGKSQMVLDSDLALEGLAAYSNWELSEGWDAFVNFGYLMIAENYSSVAPKVDETDNVVYLPQIGVKFKIEDWRLQVSTSRIAFVGLKGDPLNHTCCAAGATAKTRGNSEGGVAGTYRNDYDVSEYGIEATTKVDATELKIFWQGFKNNAVASKNQGSWLGFAIKQESWNFIMGEGRAEADATVAAFTDADLAKGETDSRGRQMTVQYQVNAQWQLALTKYDSVYQREVKNTPYKRISFDSQWSF